MNLFENLRTLCKDDDSFETLLRMLPSLQSSSISITSEQAGLLFDLVLSLIIIVDEEGRIIRLNRACEQLTGYSTQEIRGQLIGEVIFTAQLSRMLGEKATSEWIMHDGKLRLVEWQTQRFVDSDTAYTIISGYDITDQREAESALRESEARFRQLVTRMNDGLGIQDENGILIYANRKLRDMLGYTEDELIGNSLDDFLTPEGKAIHDAEMEKRRQGKASTYEMSWTKKSGDILWTSVSAEVILDEKGQYHGSFGVVSDITKRKHIESEREKLIEELDAFAGTVAHDLKNPLNLIVGYGGVLERIASTLPPETLQQYIHQILKSSRKMNTIIDELLVLAGVRGSEVNLAPLDMGQILNEATMRIGHILEDYDCEIIQPETWPIGLGHAPWIEEVWANYLTNGLKYGGQPPQLEAGATTLDDGRVKFWLKDNGAGIPESQQAQLFTPFTRLDNKIRAKGHGLGLSIVRRIVEKLGGEVGVESQIGAGSTFYFILQSA